MDWQWVATVVVVVVAGGYIALRGWRGSKSGCGGGCGCTKTDAKSQPALIPAERLVLRQRSTLDN